MKTRYAYYVEISEKAHKAVSAEEFKNLSHQWEPAAEDENGITRYYAEGIECGRRVKKY